MPQVICSYCSGSGRDAVSGAGTCYKCGGTGAEWVADPPNRSSGATIQKPRGSSSARPHTFRSFPRKERKRRQAKLHGMIRSVSLIDFFCGRVSTYLTAAGEPLVDASGDFTIAETVPRNEHRCRLETMYRSLFQTRLDTLSDQEDRDDLARALCWEARQRLAQQKAGRYIAPVDASGFKWTPSWFRTEKRLFGSKVVANKHWKVRIGAYDARCRLFIARMYGMGRGYHSFTLDGVEAAQRPAVESLLMFLESPTTRNGPLPEKLK